MLFTLPKNEMVALHVNPTVDDKVDIAITNSTSGGPFTPESVLRFRNTSNSVGGVITFTTSTNDFTEFGTTSSSLVRGDFNDDGLIDLLASKDSARSAFPLFNTNNGSFDEVFSTGEEVLSGGSSLEFDLAVGDFNLNGTLDIVFANRTDENIAVSYNLGAGEFSSFQTFKANSAVHEISIGDVDQDGDLDLIAADDVDGLQIFYNKHERFCR